MSKRPTPVSWQASPHSLTQIRSPLARVWETTTAAVLTTVIPRLFHAFLPLPVAKLIMEGGGVISHQNVALLTIWELVRLEFGPAVLLGPLSRANSLCDSLPRGQVHQLHQYMADAGCQPRRAGSLRGYGSYDRLEHAWRRTTGRLALLMALLTIGQDTLVLLASLSGGFIVFAQWLTALLVAAVGEAHFTAQVCFVLSGDFFHSSPLFSVGCVSEVSCHNEHRLQLVLECTPQRLGRHYMRMLSANHQGVYGLKAFGIGDYLADHHSPIAFADETAVAIETRPVIRFHSNALSESIRAGLEFLNVSFGYPGSVRSVLDRVSFRLEQHKKSDRRGRVGENYPSSWPDSTIQPQAILLDGIHLRENTVEDLPNEIGVISQDYMRYEMLVRENIGLGKVERHSETPRIEAAARKSVADKMTQHRRRGLDQMEGRQFESDVDLSGEWQKMVSTVRTSDAIPVPQNEGIREEGRHHELISRGGRHAELSELQTPG